MDIQDLAGKSVWVLAKGYAPDEGGMQTYARGVAEAYAAAGADVTVFTQTTAGPSERTVGPCKIIDIGAKRGITVPFRFRSALRFARLQGPPPMLIHGTTWRTSLIPWSMGLPFFTTFHGREFMYASGFSNWLMQRVAASAQAVIAVSYYSAKRLKQRVVRLKTEPVVAWNGIGFHPVVASNPVKQPEAAPLIFSLCRLEPRKNIASCVRACGALRDEGYQFRYIIAGRGEELDNVRQLIQQLKLTDCVTAMGFVSDHDASQLYRDADIFLHPQVEADGGRDFEGFGIAIADAMIAETAVIIGEQGGAIELIEQDISGFAIDGHNHQLLVQELRDLLAKPDRRKMMATAAKNRAAELFTWHRHVATILAALPQITAR